MVMKERIQQVLYREHQREDATPVVAKIIREMNVHIRTIFQGTSGLTE